MILGVQDARDKAMKNSPEAIQKRLMRKAKRVGAAAVQHVKSHRRKESLAEKLLLGPMTMDDDELDMLSKDVEWELDSILSVVNSYVVFC